MESETLGWRGVLAGALVAGGVSFVAVALMNRFLFGDGFDWAGAAWTATGPTLALLVVGVAVRRGWVPRSWGRERDGR